MVSIDLNSDLGESYGAWRMGDDQAMLDIVSSANIACGFHAGDPATILTTLRQAKDAKVAIGAHISYPDRVGFGRRKMDLSYSELFSDSLYQISALSGLAHSVNVQVRYVKPHGALYNSIAQDLAQAQAVIDAITAFDSSLAMVVLAGSPLVELAKQQGIRVIQEVFADRAYQKDGQLVSRRIQGAVIADPDLICQRMISLINTSKIPTIDGGYTSVQADSICVHGDNPEAVAIASKLRDALKQVGINIQAFS
ncbi:LamB/YcsF family protein [Celerinatantimonas diazotrophica]|uniref:5-oxoprolinase subunit A n=1 Tax=Celerinatantimonas diazotrophica TaxID=412034 RepID=A0A4R1J8G0_9GAMM|nr:5-oxoprolinase subunit PxpA [Celerinatantimonas diazotrophica]TCK46620.1 UPF0271 protein [Celerinatantimonas diazotrophica]CAG9296670.1 5-oxoprolinase subunit A [Celerinatantimonas diazotrophica]